MTPQMWTLLHEHGLPETVDVPAKLTVLQVFDHDTEIEAVYMLDVKDADGAAIKVKARVRKEAKSPTTTLVRFTAALQAAFRKDLRAAFSALFMNRKTH